MTDDKKCDHPAFTANVSVGRLLAVENGPVTAYTADVTVECAECGRKFRFVGLPSGRHFAEPRVSIDGLQLRAPIEPAEHEKFQARASYTMPGPKQ